MKPINGAGRRQLARHLLAVAFGGAPAAARPRVPALASAVRQRLAQPLADGDLSKLETLADAPDSTKATRAQRRALLRVFGLPALERANAAAPPQQRRADLDQAPLAVLAAAVRVELDPANATANDTTTLNNWVRKEGSPTVADMDDYVAEDRGLPSTFRIDPFVDAVTKRLEQLGGTVRPPFIAVVVGRLLLDGNIDASRSDFRWAVKRAYDQGVSETPTTPGTANKAHYAKIVADLKALKPGQKIRYQELAAVADHVIAAADDWDIKDDDIRRAQVQVGVLKYADGTAETGFATLELPPIVSEDASNQEIEPTNVQAVAMMAAAQEIEQTGAFDVVDRMLELFLQGMLPVRDDSGGRALNRYYWEAEDRLDASARSAQYARILGKGGSDDADVQPNAQFEQLLMRFVSSLVRYDSDLQVSTVVMLDGDDRPGSSEQVRKAAQDFAANASLYGWGFAIFAARRLSRHVDLVFDVLGQETLQRAYGVTGPWQLVERVSAVEFGSTPAVIQHRTRAKAIKDLLDLLAGYAPELSRSGGVRRFLPSAADLRGRPKPSTGGGPTVSVQDYERMVAAANNLLAVGGVTEDEIARFSAPVPSTARGSIPTVGGDGQLDQAGIDQIRQLVSQGQTPSIEQLQRLLPLGTNPLG
jgi:hypothetical protein